MNQIMKKLKLLFPLPLLLGFLGYLQCYPNDVSGGLYHSMRLYLMQYQLSEVNILLDIARWTAPCVTLACMLTGVESVCLWILCHWRKAFHPDKIIAIYGDNECTAALIDSLGPELKAVEGNVLEPFHKSSKRHVIMFKNDEDNLHFFQRYLKEFEEGDQIYLHLEHLSPNLLCFDKFEIYPFSLAERTAFYYVAEKSERLCGKAFAQDEVHVAVIGSGKYAEKLLDFSIKLNIFSLQQRFIYHVFGDFSRYRGLHYRMEQTETEHYQSFPLYPRDEVRFYHGTWEEHIELLTTMDEIVLTDDKDMENLKVADAILEYVPQQEIKNCVSVRLESESLFQFAVLKENAFHIFGVNGQICTASSILQDAVLASAKEQLSEYVALTQSTISNDAKWNSKTQHERDSNINSAYFRATALPKVPKQLRKKKLPLEEQLEFMAELEHIRWNRFHYLRNWLFDENAEKPTRDSLRIHKCLTGYEELDADLKYYDQKEAIKVISDYYNKTIATQNKKLDGFHAEDSLTEAQLKKQEKAKKELQRFTRISKEASNLALELENAYRMRNKMPLISEEKKTDDDDDEVGAKKKSKEKPVKKEKTSKKAKSKK